MGIRIFVVQSQYTSVEERSFFSQLAVTLSSSSYKYELFIQVNVLHRVVVCKVFVWQVFTANCSHHYFLAYFVRRLANHIFLDH